VESRLQLADQEQHSSGIIPGITTVAAGADVGVELDLVHIATHVRNAEFNPKKFPSVCIHLRNPKATGLLFRTGKIVIIGARCEADSRLATRKLARILQKLNYEVKVDELTSSFKINNMVGRADVGFPIRLEALAAHPEHSRWLSYEPELYAGLIYRVEKPKCSMLIFVSGKIIIAGCKSREDMYQAFEQMYGILYFDFRKSSGDDDEDSHLEREKRSTELDPDAQATQSKLGSQEEEEDYEGDYYDEDYEDDGYYE
jgi:transcription initiation factor TFIID TATA-box-binding protein